MHLSILPLLLGLLIRKLRCFESEMQRPRGTQGLIQYVHIVFRGLSMDASQSKDGQKRNTDESAELLFICFCDFLEPGLADTSGLLHPLLEEGSDGPLESESTVIHKDGFHSLSLHTS